ncbi:MAG: cytochrome c [Acidobacteria bacterium]|nr:cytochrome c [Acidobacteriota bacterium]
MQVVLSLVLIGLGVLAQDSLRETRVSSPEIVRTDYDMAEVVTPPSLPADALAGWKLFVQRCAICHDPLGQPSYPASFAPPLSRATVGTMGEDVVRDVIEVGSARMPGWQYTLSPEQIGEVIAYLNTVTLE